MANADITQERVRQVFSYDPVSGIFRWRINKPPHYKIGDAADLPFPHGYLRIRFDATEHLAHRLAVFYMTGEWPPLSVDHIDGNPSNNAFANLRCVTQSVNGQNRRTSNKNNSSGFLGVTKNGKVGWMAQLKINREKVYLGTFRSPELAYQSYLAAKRKLHPGNML